jgi:TPR repeat protein
VAAEAGDPDAQYQLACACAGDFGAAPRSEEAVEWFEAAAGQGNRNAQYRVAMLLLDRGDTVKAEDWLYAAARAGSIDAGRALAQMFDASPDGDAERLFRMGELNEWGWNGTCKLEKAAALYKDAAQEGHAAAMYRIGRLYYYQYKAMDLDPVDSLRHATAWLRQAAPANPDAALLLGQISLNGNDARGLRRDHVEAMTWLAMAAAGGNVDATALLGWLYLGNDGVEVDRPRAVYLLSRAAAAGHARAQYSLARLCESDGCADTARLWYKRAARGRVAEAAAALARIYRDGVDCRADRDAAGAWRRYAIELGYS